MSDGKDLVLAQSQSLIVAEKTAQQLQQQADRLFRRWLKAGDIAGYAGTILGTCIFCLPLIVGAVNNHSFFLAWMGVITASGATTISSGIIAVVLGKKQTKVQLQASAQRRIVEGHKRLAEKQKQQAEEARNLIELEAEQERRQRLLASAHTQFRAKLDELRRTGQSPPAIGEVFHIADPNPPGKPLFLRVTASGLSHQPDKPSVHKIYVRLHEASGTLEPPLCPEVPGIGPLIEDMPATPMPISLPLPGRRDSPVRVFSNNSPPP